MNWTKKVGRKQVGRKLDGRLIEQINLTINIKLGWGKYPQLEHLSQLSNRQTANDCFI